MSENRIKACYSVVQKKKKKCYTNVDAITVTENCAEVSLQALLDHTSSCLLEYLGEIIERLEERDRDNIVIIYKWACDGSKQLAYKQKFENSEDFDKNIFQSSILPLRVLCDNNRVIWQNPTPSSARYCRPIRIRFANEAADIIREGIQCIEAQISNFKKTDVTIGTYRVHIEHKLLFTMIDGKVCNAAMDTKSTLRCYICGATATQFNYLSREN